MAVPVLHDHPRVRRLRNEAAAIIAEQDAILTEADSAGELTEDLKKKYQALEVRSAAVAEHLQAAESVAARLRGVKIVPDDNQAAEGEAAEEGEKEFRSFGQFLSAVATAQRTGIYDERLRRAASGMNEGTLSEGGALVNQETATELADRLYNTGEILSRVRRRPIGENANGVKIALPMETSRATGTRYAGAVCYWAGEGTAPTLSDLKTRTIEMGLKKLIAAVPVTDELLADAVALEAFVVDAFEEAMRFEAENAIINGTGAGQPAGILTSPALVTVAKESGPQTADTIVFANTTKMFARLHPGSMQSAVWLINQAVLPQLLAMTVGGTAAVPAYLPPAGASATPYGTLWGRPVIAVEYAAGLGDVGDILLVDLNQYLWIDKGPVQRATSMHVKFLEDEMVFRFTWRVNGQTRWNSAVTPFKGSDTVSPFVALEAR